MRLRQRVYKLMNPVDSERPAARVIEAVLLLLIFTNILALVLESVEDINAEYGGFFVSLEFFSVMVFTVEYFLRVWSVWKIRSTGNL
jgi:voltage-gated potassium channel